MIFDAIKRFFAMLMVIFTCMPQAMFAPKQKKEADVLLNAVVIADIHTDGDPTRDRNNLLRQEFTGLTRYAGKTDALIMDGDITNCGDRKEYINIKSMLRTYVKTGQLIPVMGNHDSWNQSSDPDFEEATRLFQKFCRFCKIKTDRNYYSIEVKGYKFIILGTEALSHDQATFSDEQLGWLDSELAAEAGNGKPVFIMCHQTLEGKNGTSGPGDGGCIGSQSPQVEAILKKYADNGMTLLYTSGHMHDMGTNSFQKDGNIYYLNLPAFQYDGGIGCSIKVYEDRIALQFVDYLNGTELEDYSFDIEL